MEADTTKARVNKKNPNRSWDLGFVNYAAYLGVSNGATRLMAVTNAAFRSVV